MIDGLYIVNCQDFSDPAKRLGNGHYGNVAVGTLQCSERVSFEVAVKSVESKQNNSNYIKALENEGDILNHIGEHGHPHIVKFYGSYYLKSPRCMLLSFSSSKI